MRKQMCWQKEVAEDWRMFGFLSVKQVCEEAL